MMCTDCTLAFFQSPLKIGIVAISLLISIISLLILKTKSNMSANKKISLVYLHIFALLFPLFFYLFFNGCSSLFSACSTAKATIYLLIITGVTAALVGVIAAPILFLVLHKRNSKRITQGFAFEFIAEKTSELSIKQPHLYVMKTAKPVAFSFSLFSPSIFISAGMADVLTKKEIEAVLLHEISHIKNSSSQLKLSTSLMRMLSPASHVASFKDELSKDEQEADAFAISNQGTRIHLKTVKQKLLEYAQSEGE